MCSGVPGTPRLPAEQQKCKVLKKKKQNKTQHKVKQTRMAKNTRGCDSDTYLKRKRNPRMGWRFKWGTRYEDNMLACLEMRTSRSFYTWSQILIFLMQEKEKKKKRCYIYIF